MSDVGVQVDARDVAFLGVPGAILVALEDEVGAVVIVGISAALAAENEIVFLSGSVFVASTLNTAGGGSGTRFGRSSL